MKKKLETQLRDNYIRALSDRLEKESKKSKDGQVAVSEFEKELKKRLNEEPLEQFTKKEINALKSRVAKLASEVVEQKLLQEITKIVLDKVLPELDKVRMKKEVPHDHTKETLRPDKLFPTYCSLRTAQIKEDQITDLVHDATKIQGVTVDDAAIADGKPLKYVSATDKIEYGTDTGVTAHGDLTGVTANQHHTKYTDAEVDAIVAVHDAIVDAHHAKYTDAEAVSAVEAEATLDLTGKLTVDHVGEKTGSHNIVLDNDLDLDDTHSILFKPDVIMYGGNLGWVYLKNAAKTGYRHLAVNILSATSFSGTSLNSIFKSFEHLNATMTWQAWSGAGWTICAWLNAGTSPDLTINRAGDITFLDGKNIAVDTTTGTKIGTATNQKIGFFNATPVVQQAFTAVSDPPTQAEVTAIRDAFVNLGLMASS